MTATAMTIKGQVTIPKPIRDALHLRAGSKVAFELNAAGEVVLRPADPAPASAGQDRFSRARGKADLKWRTDELMQLLRGDD